MKSNIIAILMAAGAAYFMFAFIKEDTQVSAALGNFFYYSKWVGLAAFVLGFIFLNIGQPKRK